MTTEALQTFYEERLANFNLTLSSVKKNINIVSNFRLLAAALFIASVYFGIATPLLFFFAAAVLAAFLMLMKQHTRLFSEKIHIENLVKLNAYELKLLKGDFSSFDGGHRFINPAHPYSHDLDIFGSGSVYQYLNRTSTLHGAEELANSLQRTSSSPEAIAQKQKAVSDLRDRVDFRQHFWATGRKVDELPRDRQQLLEWTKHQSFVYGKKRYAFVLLFLPSVTIGCMIASIFMDGVFSYAIYGALMQWMILSFHLKRVNAFHGYISDKKNILQKYAQLLHLFKRENFESSLLKELAGQAVAADANVKSLASWVNALDARLNFMTNLIVNSVFLYDLQCVYRLEKWKEENAVHLIGWMKVIDEADLLCSFATFGFNNTSFTFPSIINEQKITATGMAHPLIPEGERVSSDIALGDSAVVMIITGANMAGKSTFLRTLGVNMVLALNGAPVCASSFSCPVIEIRSGMRTADSLQNHQSYFYAELNRLKMITDELRSGKPLLILLDEILKGTNSTDKLAGSVALVKQLLAHRCLAIIATHDLALGELENDYPSRVENYCFEPTIENDQLSFDYQLKRGLAQKMNATFLMRKMGIIGE